MRQKPDRVEDWVYSVIRKGVEALRLAILAGQTSRLSVYMPQIKLLRRGCLNRKELHMQFQFGLPDPIRQVDCAIEIGFG